MSNNEYTDVLLAAYVTDPDNNVMSVVIDLSSIGESESQTMYDDGSHGDVTAGDGTYSFLINVPKGWVASTKNLPVTATDADTQTGIANLAFEVYQPGTIVDNPDAAYVGDWPESTLRLGWYGDNYQFHVAGDGTNTATWSLSVPTAGYYNVYAWWATYSNHATNAPYTIHYEGGSSAIRVSQRNNGEKWNLLGDYFFDAGTYTVVLSDDADGDVIADAIKLELRSEPGIAWPIADNWDATFVGSWPAETWEVAGETYGTDCQFPAGGAGIGENTATWTLAVPSAGNYNVYAWWPESSGYAADAPYTINYEGGAESVEVCQQIRGGQWNYLGNYPFNAGNYTVVLSDDASGTVIADAIKFESGSAPANPYPIADNWDATFIGPWGASTVPAQYYGDDYQYHAAGIGLNTGTWKTDIPGAGYYSVYARWPEYYNNATNAPYTVYYEGVSELVTVDQQSNGGRWMYLGNYPFNAETYAVVLSDDANWWVNADAIKWERGIVVDNVEADFTGTWTETTGSTDRFGTSYSYHAAGSGSDTATWYASIPAAGYYNVYAWWTQHSNRATDAPYTINYDGGSQTVDVNQEVNGGRWNLLGTYSFSGGSYSVVLSDDANEYVIADAIKWVPLDGDPNEGSQICNHISPEYSISGMTFTAELYDADGISSVQVWGNSYATGWIYEDMINTVGNTWTKVLGANNWVEDDGYYFKITDSSLNVTFIGCGGEQYSIEGGYADNGAAEAAVRGDTYPYGGGPCSP